MRSDFRFVFTCLIVFVVMSVILASCNGFVTPNVEAYKIACRDDGGIPIYSRRAHWYCQNSRLPPYLEWIKDRGRDIKN